MVQCKVNHFQVCKLKLRLCVHSKVFYGISCVYYSHGAIFKLYEINVAKMQWKEINGPNLIEGKHLYSPF